MKLPKPLSSDEIATISEYLMKASYTADNLVNVVKFVDISVSIKLPDGGHYSPWSDDLRLQIQNARELLIRAYNLISEIEKRELS